MRTPEELVEIGFQRSPLVIVNECHDGDSHCPRTREIWRRMLPVAHAAGVRHLAMEALIPPFADAANTTHQLPEMGIGYLAQPDMRELIGDAISLGWQLIAYECDFTLWRGGSTLSASFANWRDAEESRNLTEFLRRMPTGTQLLVWCGHSHQRKTPQSYPGLVPHEWVRLGQRLRELSGIDPFVIDQSVTVNYRGRRPPRQEDLARYSDELQRLGGTAGFLREEDPDQLWRDDLSADAWLLSLDNEMVKDV